MKNTRLTILLLSTVSAFTIQSQTVNAQQSATSADDAFSVDTIVVTSRRRSEALKDVPGTVTALTSTVIESAGIQRAEDFMKLTPGVSMVNAAEVGDTQVNIRGINGARDAENSFAYILDGILYSNPAAFNREYTDLTQIEVFKGPQGAIYGRNAAAGAIIVNTARPDGETGIKSTIGVADDNTFLLKSSVTGALDEDKLFFRVSGDFRKSDGHYRNSFLDDAAVVDRFESYNVNGRLVLEANENLTFDTKMRYGKVDAGSIVFNSTFNLPVFAEVNATPSAFQDVNDFDFLFQGNVPSQNDQKSVEISTKFDYDMDEMQLTGWVLYSDIKNNLMSDGTSAAFGFYAPDAACQASTSALAYNIDLLPPQFIGASPLGVMFTEDFSGSFMGAYTPTTCDGVQEQLRNQKDISAELRLSSNTDGPFQWMVGSYFLDIDREVGVSLNRDSGDPVIRGLYQASGPNATASLTHDQFDSRVFAVFSQAQWDVNQDFQISAALRYDNEKRKVSSLVPFDATQSVIDLNGDFVFNDPLNPALSPLFNTTGTIPDKERTFAELEPKVSFTYDVSDDFTVFGSWGVGFKAGGFNNSGSQATVDIFINGMIEGDMFNGSSFATDMGVPLPVIKDDFEKETSNAFELGFKGSIFDGRLQFNAAAYHTTITDMQFFEFIVGPFGLLRVVSNIDEVEVMGIEFGSTFHINENFRMYGGANFVDSEIKSNSSRTDTVGNKSPYTPDYTINIGADFDYPISNEVTFFGRVDTQFTGQTWFHTVQEGQRPTIFMPLFEISYFGPASAPFGIADYSVDRRDSYHTVDVRFGISGEAWKLTAYASNLTNQSFLEEVIPAPEFGGTFSHPGSMRRFGAEFSFQF